MRTVIIVTLWVLLWVLTGTLLWMTTLRVYGRRECFCFEHLHRCGSECRFVRYAIPSPAERLAWHVIAAPVFLVCMLWYHFAWKGLLKIGEAATRFAEWYAPSDMDEEEESQP